MRNIALYLAAIATLFCASSKAEAPSGPSVQLDFFIYSLPLQEGVDFLITKNPVGNASLTLDQVDEFVRTGKATLIDSPVLKGKSGEHFKVKSEKSSIEVEAVVSKDKSALCIASQVEADGTKILGQQTVSFGSALFNGALKTPDGKSLIVVYAIPFLK
jgi:hypothetical protein